VHRIKRAVIVLSMVAFAAIAIIIACHADRTVRTEIMIQRTPSAVWQVLITTGEYSAWNPMIDKIVGDLREGNVIEVDQGMVFHPTVLAVHPNQELRWKGGKFLLPISRRMPLRDAGEAHALAQRGGLGKIVLVCR
jgi:hypothetical protein